MAQRGYRHAIDEFIDWYCSEPRLSFSKSVVLRYRIHLESRHLAPGTINLRLGAVRRLALRGVRLRPVKPRLGGRHTTREGCQEDRCPARELVDARTIGAALDTPDSHLLKGKRDRALLAVVLACGLRRHEAVNLEFSHIQQREDHWAIVDLKGKAGHTRTIPMPGWVKTLVNAWAHAANLTAGKLFRRVNKNGKAWGDGLTEKAVC